MYIYYDARIKNPSSEGGISCYDPCIRLVNDDNKTHGVCFMSQGCQNYSHAYAGNTLKAGYNDDDVSALTADFSNFQWKSKSLFRRSKGI